MQLFSLVKDALFPVNVRRLCFIHESDPLLLLYVFMDTSFCLKCQVFPFLMRLLVNSFLYQVFLVCSS